MTSHLPNPAILLPITNSSFSLAIPGYTTTASCHGYSVFSEETVVMASSIDGPVKQQLVDKLPKRFKGIKFGIQLVAFLAYFEVVF